MKSHIIAALLCLPALTSAVAAEDSTCIGINTDATFGAQMARDNATFAQAEAAINKSVNNIDAELLKAKRKKLTIEMKERMRNAFLDGYSEAKKHPEDTIERVAGRVALDCYFAKHK
ncbi:hypothetical protein [Massilia sp. erpn]|uniref:hypothetical protein n=1 Tax=Massilia sp. erpn TaxID=2738142 RepID=UPI002106CBC7|nr:hypothetical protein [Massilia sp. erpn]UTY57696.1 hypothetical protein HPQ68_11190 [Massilia sp. erpn]